MPRYFKPRTGAFRYRSDGEGPWISANPGDVLYSTVTMLATQCYGADGWKDIDPPEEIAEPPPVPVECGADGWKDIDPPEEIAEPPPVPVECGANGGQACDMRPGGPGGSVQCHYCGAPPVHVVGAVNPWHPMTDPVGLKTIGKLLEELGEATAAASRCMIQGDDGRDPETGQLNRDWLQDELADVEAQIQLAKERFKLFIDPARVARKIENCRAWHRMA